MAWCFSRGVDATMHSHLSYTYPTPFIKEFPFSITYCLMIHPKILRQMHTRKIVYSPNTSSRFLNHKSYSNKHFIPELMMMNYFCGMLDRRKVFSLIFSQDHCQRSSPSRISDTARAGLEPMQNLSSGFFE